MTHPHTRHQGEPDPGRLVEHQTTAPVRPDHHIGPPDDPELLIEVHRLTDPVLRRIRQEHGPIPTVGSTAWWEAATPDWVRLGALLIPAVRWLVCDPERTVRGRLKAASVAIAEGHDWTAASRRPSHAELVRRRAEPGPGARPFDSFDAAAATRWVATGSSAGVVVA